MPRGRKPQPDAVKEAKGNPGRHPRKSFIEPENNVSGSAPKELSAEARAFWNRLVPDLTALRFIRDTDRMAFSRYCEHAVKWWKLTQDLKKNGDTYITDSNHGKMERIRPAFLVRERIERHLVELEDRFGLNPVYRQQILQRMAGEVPAPPPGGLFNQSDDNTKHEPTLDVPAPSAIGLLVNAGTAIN